MTARPTSAEEVAEAVRSYPAVAARGGGTKAALIGEGEVIAMEGLAGITEYEASEYTFTARAGTRVQEVAEVLAAKRQYLPFDPLLGEAGATLGGTVAAGISGPGRFRYGGLRDFLIGVQFVDGCGTPVRAGGKVVKNAAGFDLAKFLVGGAGRFGILTEVSFKVFPAPVCRTTLEVHCDSISVAMERIVEVAASRWEAEALDYEAASRTLLVRLGGPADALELLAADVIARWPEDSRRLTAEEEAVRWRHAGELRWVREGATVVKVPLTPSRLVALEERLAGRDDVQRWYSGGAAVAWLAAEGAAREEIDGILRALGLEGLVVRGKARGAPWIGLRRGGEILAAVKKALDPEGRFPAIS